VSSPATGALHSGHLFETTREFSMHSRQKTWLQVVAVGSSISERHTEQVSSSSCEHRKEVNSRLK